jgi:hypothetical protein
MAPGTISARMGMGSCFHDALRGLWNGVFFDEKAARFCGLEGDEDDYDDEQAEEQRTFVGDGVDDGIFVEEAAGGLEP